MSAAEGVNIPLLRKAIEWAEVEAAKPEIDRQWDQGEWMREPHQRAERLLWGTQRDGERQFEDMVAAHCGTAYCLAGYIGQSLEKAFETDWVVDGLGHVEAFATDALGIDRTQASRLFDGGNTIEDVRRIAEDIAGERL